MSYFVRRYKAYEVAHQFLVELHCTSAFIHSSCLNHIPLVEEFHHVVIPAHVAFYNFTTARVGDVRTVGITFFGREVANYVEAGIF